MMRILRGALILLMVLLIPASSFAAEMTLSYADGAVSYAVKNENDALYIVCRSTDFSCAFVAERGEDGTFSGKIEVGGLPETKTFSLEAKTLFQKSVAKEKLVLEREAVNLQKPEKGAAGKLSDLQYAFDAQGLKLSFTAEGHHAVTLAYTAVSQSGRMILSPDANGVFSASLALPYLHARDMVSVKLISANKRVLASFKERVPFIAPPEGPQAADGPLCGVTVCIDPGHQGVPVSTGRVPQMPDAKKFVSGGSNGMAQGKVTLRRESIVALEIAYRLRDALRAQGATVFMTRYDEETPVTNMRRAEIANEGGADYLLRLHLNSESKGTADAMDVYIPFHSPYAVQCTDHETYKAMGEKLLDALKEATGEKYGLVHSTDRFIASNWAKMPTFLVELGFMTTPSADLLSSMPAYQEKMARGLTEGILALEAMKKSAAVTE